MLRIHCPHCGTRSLNEWVYGEILDVPDDVVDVSLDRAFHHTNRAGVVDEVWFHLYGCRRWIPVRRNTLNDEVIE